MPADRTNLMRIVLSCSFSDQRYERERERERICTVTRRVIGSGRGEGGIRRERTGQGVFCTVGVVSVFYETRDRVVKTGGPVRFRAGSKRAWNPWPVYLTDRVDYGRGS